MPYQREIFSIAATRGIITLLDSEEDPDAWAHSWADAGSVSMYLARKSHPFPYCDAPLDMRLRYVDAVLSDAAEFQSRHPGYEVPKLRTAVALQRILENRQDILEAERTGGSGGRGRI